MQFKFFFLLSKIIKKNLSKRNKNVIHCMFGGVIIIFKIIIVDYVQL